METSNVRAFFTAFKVPVLLLELVMALFYSCVLISHDNSSVNQHVQYQDTESKAENLNLAIIDVIIHS